VDGGVAGEPLVLGKHHICRYTHDSSTDMVCPRAC
jgi:hypothetical protein